MPLISRESSLIDQEKLTESHIALNMFRPLLRRGIVPGDVLDVLPIRLEIVITTHALPWTGGMRAAVCQERFILDA